MFGLFKKIKIIDDLIKEVDALKTNMGLLSKENETLRSKLEEVNELADAIKTQNRPIPFVVSTVYDLQKEVDVIKNFQQAKMDRFEKNKRLSEFGKNRRYRRN